MKISKVMLAAVFLTAAILAILSGVITNVLAARSAASQAASTTELNQYKDREAQYQQVIQQANQQLEKANNELQALQQRTNDLKSTTPAAVENTAENTVSAAVSADKAGQIAENAAALGQALQKTPELVSFEGKAAYEAVFEKGSIYIDAQSGAVLFNRAVPQKLTPSKAAKVAADYMKDSEILQVDQIDFRGAPIYRVIFKDGTMVYMDLTGQITYIQKASPNVVVVQQASTSGGSSAPSSASAPQETEHEDGN
jgi:hypothetical protein